MEGLLLVGGIIAAFFVIGWALDTRADAQKYQALKPELDNLKDLERKLSKTSEELEAAREKLKQDRDAIQILYKEKSWGFPWLANAYADYFELQDRVAAHSLERKQRPAMKAAQTVREIARERRRAEKKLRVFRYRIEYYENLFPWLVEFVGQDVDELLENMLSSKESRIETGSVSDPAEQWLTAGEYQHLSTAEKYQLALDRHDNKKKSKWEIGRDYERYVGYLYEKDGFVVRYQGIIKGFEDLGRDIIASRGAETHIAQCKYWSQYKKIHEKHIFQLFGTTVEYILKQRKKSGGHQAIMFSDGVKNFGVKPIFITSTVLSDKARDFADSLQIKVKEKFVLENYPKIKCNISRQTAEKIYHLPFDQQYDRVVVEAHRGECYVSTVKEAEDLGFRRAWRWRPNEKD